MKSEQRAFHKRLSPVPCPLRRHHAVRFPKHRPHHIAQQVRFTGEDPTLALAAHPTLTRVVACISPLAGYYADSFSFSYVVSPGDASSDLSYTFTGALFLANSTEIVDESGEVANVTLPEVGSSLSVTGGDVWEAEGALVVDTSNVVMYVTALNENGVYYAGESIFIQVMGQKLFIQVIRMRYKSTAGVYFLSTGALLYQELSVGRVTVRGKMLFAAYGE